MRITPKAIGIIALAVFTGLLVAFGLSHRTVVQPSVMDPSGRYTAICTYKTYLSLIPMTPGGSSDKPCFVKIIDSSGRNHGEIPIPSIQMAGVEWTPHGAEIKSIGEWDFSKGTCFYWSSDQTRRIDVR